MPGHLVYIRRSRERRAAVTALRANFQGRDVGGDTTGKLRYIAEGYYTSQGYDANDPAVDEYYEDEGSA